MNQIEERVSLQVTINLNQKYIIHSNLKMKDRWKILIASIIIGSALSMLFFFLGFSFKIVGPRQYGVLFYTFYGTVDQTQTVRGSGNYLVGLDYGFITYPRGLLKHQFSVDVLTKDKSMVNINGLFLGRLIESEIINLHFAYGPSQFFALVSATVEQVFRQSIEQFLLTEIIAQRASINSYVASNVCLSVESKYSFISCQHASTGKLTVNAKPILIQPQTDIQQNYKNILKETIFAQKKFNVYGNGGFTLIDNVQKLNSELFLNTTQLIVSTITDYTTDSSQVFAAAAYILDNPLMPILSNQIPTFSLDSNK